MRLAPLPPKTMLPLGTSTVSEEKPVGVRLAAAVSISPTAKASGPVAVSSLIATLPGAVRVGRSLTEVTVSRKELLAKSGPSLTITVISVVPN